MQNADLAKKSETLYIYIEIYWDIEIEKSKLYRRKTPIFVKYVDINT